MIVRKVRHILLNCSETNHFSMNFYSLCVNYTTCKGTCQILFFYDHYLMSDWGTNIITHTFMADSSPGWRLPSTDATDDRDIRYLFLFSYTIILLIVCGESMFIHGKVSTLLTKKQKNIYPDAHTFFHNMH